MRLAVAMVAVFLLPLSASAESLGEAARKETQRRAQNRAAGVKARTYDDGDVRTHASDQAETATPRDAAARPAPEESRVREELDRETDKRQQQEQMWRQRAEAARGRLDEAQRFLSAGDAERLKLSGG